MAVFKFLGAMAAADGKVDPREVVVSTLEGTRMGLKTSEIEDFLKEVDKMEYSEALAHIAQMNTENKKYVAAVLGVMMDADGKINVSEFKLWNFVSYICKLPPMNLAEALTYYNNLSL